MTHRVVLAVNPTAGRGRGAPAGEAVAGLLAGHGVEVLRAPGGCFADVEAGAHGLLAAGRADVLVVVGGDGMTHLGVNAVAGTPARLGIVAVGTGNDIARDLGLPVRDVPAAVTGLVAAVVSGNVRAVDAVYCPGAAGPGPGGDRWFLGVLGAGFDAIVNERANRWRWPRGRLRYDLALLRELPVLRPRAYVLELDGEPWRVDALLVAVGNTPSYGGGMRVCPDAVPDDGQLDVVVVEPMSRASFVRIFPRVYRGTHVHHRLVTARRAARVRIVAEGIVGYADGERLGPLPLVCETVPGALRLLVPPG